MKKAKVQKNDISIPDVWTFKSEEVAKKFQSHVKQTLPWYDLATEMTAHIVKNYVSEGSTVYDFGCSTGNLAAVLEDTVKSRDLNFIGVDNSVEMKDVFESRQLNSTFELGDIGDYPKKPFDVAVCFLVLMFMKPARRGPWLSRLVERLAPGGAVIIFDKVSFEGYLSVVMHRFTMQTKLDQGISHEDILKKELSLYGVQRTLDPFLLSQLESQSTSLSVNKVFQFGEFCGWVIEKSEIH